MAFLPLVFVFAPISTPVSLLPSSEELSGSKLVSPSEVLALDPAYPTLAHVRPHRGVPAPFAFVSRCAYAGRDWKTCVREEEVGLFSCNNNKNCDGNGEASDVR